MDKYGHARNRVQLGKWVVDAEAGVIYGRFGRQIGKPTSLGYARATLYVGKDQFDVYLHRVIWESVHGPIPAGLQVNHKNGLKDDNRIANLEVVTPSENVRHAHRTGLNRPARGMAHHKARLTDEQIADFRRRYAAGGVPQKQLAAEFGISKAQACRLVHGARRTEDANGNPVTL